MELTYRLGRRVSLAEFGALIAEDMGREAPFTAAAVSRWESGDQVPGPEVIEAIGRLTGTDAGWIPHGEKTAAPPPPRSGEYAKYEPTSPRRTVGNASAKDTPPAEPPAPSGANPADSTGPKRKRRRSS